MPTRIPPRYLGSPGIALWSLYLNGTEVPLNHDLAVLLANDESVGSVFIKVVVDGVLRTKYGFGSLRFGLEVICPAFINTNVSNVVQECSDNLW